MLKVKGGQEESAPLLELALSLSAATPPCPVRHAMVPLAATMHEKAWRIA